MYLLEEDQLFQKQESLEHGFPLRRELVQKGAIHASQLFQGGNNLYFLQIHLFTWVEENMNLSKVNGLCQKLPLIVQCFFVKIELVFVIITSCKSEFSRWRKAHFGPNPPILLKGRNTFICRIKSTCVTSSTNVKLCVPVQIELVSGRSTSWNVGVSRQTQALWRQTGLSTSVEGKHVSLERKPSWFETGSGSTLFPSED